MKKYESIQRMLKLAKRLDEIVFELEIKREKMLNELYRKAA